MKKATIVIFLTFMFCTINGFSQQKSLSTPRFTDSTNYFHYIKISPFNLLEIESSLMVGYSYPVNNGKAQLQHELGYVFLNEAYFPYNETDRSFNGFKIRNNYRSYFVLNSKRMESRNQRNRWYFGLDLMYKYCKYVELNQNVWMLNGQYIQIMDMKTNKHVGALHFITGFENNFIKNSGHILDFYLGIGLRYKELNSSFDGMSSSTFGDGFVQQYRLWYDEIEIPLFMSVMAGMKIGFSL
ncbi:hypothetical protein ACFLQ5_01485 [Bacteroidota bacterium]